MFLVPHRLAHIAKYQHTDAQHKTTHVCTTQMTTARIGMPAQYEMIASFSPTVFSHSPPASFDYSVSDR